MGGPPATPAPSWWPGLLQRVQDRLVGPDPVLVAVDGRSGAGKTDLAREAADLLAGAGRPTQVVHLDSLYPGWSGLAAALPRLCDQVVTPLLAGRPGRYRAWDWDAGRPGPWVVVPRRAVVVVEGVGVLASPCATRFDVRLWLEAPAQVRRIRALARDGEVFAPHWRHWAEQEDAVLAGRPPADAVVDTLTGRTRWSRDRPGSTEGPGGTRRPGSTGRPGTGGSASAPRWDRLGP